MIITLKGCTATAFIGGLNFFKVSKGTVSGADVTISASTINKDAATSTSAREIATVALKSNYENLVVTVTMGGTTVNWFADGKVTIPANTTVTGDIKISASATAIVPDVPDTPDEPDTPTMYTFTINPTPTNATVTLTASRYSQSGNSITVPSGTSVSWKVSASGYTQQTGTHTVTKTESKSVVLSVISGGNTGGNTGDNTGGSVEDETGITWYIDNAAQANKNFNYTVTFPGAALIAEDKAEALRNVPINVIKFMPSPKTGATTGGKFYFAKLTPGTEPSTSDIYFINIPDEDVYASAPSNDATAKTYKLDNPITLKENEYLVMNYLLQTGRDVGFWVNPSGQPEYKVGAYDRNTHELKPENWGLPFSIGYKS